MAVRFDGNSFYTATLGLGSISAFTMTAWVKISVDRNDFSTFWCIDNGTADRVILQTDDDGQGGPLVYNWGSFGSVIVPNAWHFVGVSSNGSTANLLVGFPAPEEGYDFLGDVLTSTPVTANNLRFGTSVFGAAENLNGCLASVKMWNGYAMSFEEMETESNYFGPFRTANVASYYRFDTASTVDDSGNGRTLTATGTPTTEASPDHLIEAPAGATPFKGWGIPIF